MSSFQQIAEDLEAAPWTFAKTMAHNPHWWTLRKGWAGKTPFEDVVQYIRDYGRTVRFGKTDYRIWNLNGMRYWSMGAPLPDTILINRTHEPVDATQAYDHAADDYDKWYAGEKFDHENDIAFDHIPPSVESLLDIGCGTGLALDYIETARYVGIDPSVRMLERLKRKFNTALMGEENFILLPCAFENFHLKERFDHAVCMFGSASYITHAHVKRIPDYVKPGGTYTVMLYRDGYTPLSHTQGIKAGAYKHPKDILPGDVTEVGEGHWMIVGEVPPARARKRFST